MTMNLVLTLANGEKKEFKGVTFFRFDSGGLNLFSPDSKGTKFPPGSVKKVVMEKAS